MEESSFSDPFDLLNEQTAWGMTVSEKTARKSIMSRILLLGGYSLLAIGSVLVLPILAATFLNAHSSGIWTEFAIVAFCVVVGLAFKIKSGKLPRNSIQIDYKASELRLGFRKPDNTFIRERVINFRDIDSVHVENGNDGSPKLCVALDGSFVSMGFNKAELTSVQELAREIAAARESARQAPIRSRIQSRINGIGASIREVKSRVQSTIVHA